MRKLVLALAASTMLAAAPAQADFNSFTQMLTNPGGSGNRVIGMKPTNNCSDNGNCAEPAAAVVDEPAAQSEPDEGEEPDPDENDDNGDGGDGGDGGDEPDQDTPELD